MSGRSRPTISEVARLAGVSPTTVSYVLSGPPEAAARISDETASRIHEVVTEIGYVPNQSARTLRMQRTNRVLFLANRLSSLYSQSMAQTLEAALASHGLSLSVQVGNDGNDIRRAITILDQHLADGLIVETGNAYLPELRAAAESGHAVVAIGPTRPEPSIDVIVYQDARAIQDAMEHLMARHTNQAVLLSAPSANQMDDRSSVAFEALVSMGVAPSAIQVIQCPHDRVQAYHMAMDFLPRLAHPVAVYAGSDVSAIGVLWACLRLGLRVPGDVAILGHGDNLETEITVPPLTTLGPISRDSSMAAEYMVSRLKKRSRPGRHIVQSWQLVRRGST